MRSYDLQQDESIFAERRPRKLTDNFFFAPHTKTAVFWAVEASVEL